MVVFGTLGVVVGFAACDGDSESFHPNGSDGGEPGEAGEGPGGEASGGTTATGGVGGRNPGRGGAFAGGGMSGVSGVAGSSLGATGGSGAGAGNGGSASVPCGSYDCALMPHVRRGAPVSCVDGVCVIPPDSCEEGFAHCSTNLNVGCETDLHSSTSCASCDTRCSGTTPYCTLAPSGWHCSQGCEEPTPDRCSFNCVDFETDDSNCGACGFDCTNAHAPGTCVDGQCVRTGACDERWGDCDGTFGCESDLSTPENCGACGRNDCGATNALAECSSLSACVAPTCIASFGNCDRTSLDCEARYGAACFPTYAGTTKLAAFPQTSAVAVADGGGFAVGGFFPYEVDFDASSGVDVHTSIGESDAFVTVYGASGAYVRTLTFGGASADGVTALAFGADGSFAVGGTFYELVDLDPGPAVDPHQSDSRGAGFVSKLGASGNYVWGRHFQGAATISQVATDATGAVYAMGIFYEEIDLDPGSSSVIRSASYTGTFVVKLDAAGDYAWDATLEGDSHHEWMGLAIASDGNVWATGLQNVPSTLLGVSLGAENGIVVASFAPGGTLRALWSPGGPSAPTSRATVAATTNVHVGGYFDRALDVDPGSGTTLRVVPASGGFSIGLDASGGYRNAHVFATQPTALAATPGGGSLVLVPPDFAAVSAVSAVHDLRAFYSDGTSAWTLRPSQSLSQLMLAASSTHFVLFGIEGESADYDPGPATDTVTGPAQVVTRFAF